MPVRRPVVVVVVAALVASVGVARAQERKVTRADVSKAALDAVVKKYPDAKLRAFAKETDAGKVVFEVELASPRQGRVSVDVTPEGKIMAEETIIKVAAVPAVVKAGLAASKYEGWRVVKAERVIEQEKDESPIFELVVRSKHKTVEVVLDKDGRITREEQKAPGDED